MVQIAFYFFSSVLVFSSFMVVFARNLVHSVFYLILCFLNAAGLFVLLGVEFLAMLLVIVYVGAVAVLFLFVVMMLDISPSRDGIAKTMKKNRWWYQIENLAWKFLKFSGALMLCLALLEGVIWLLEWGAKFCGYSEVMVELKSVLYILAGIVSYAIMRYGLGLSLFEVSRAFIRAFPLTSIPAFVVLAELSFVIAYWESFNLKEAMILAPAPNPRHVTNTHALGKVLYTDYVFFLEIAGLILLVAVIGAIVLTHRKREGVKRQDVRRQIARCKDDTLRLQDVPVGKGV